MSNPWASGVQNMVEVRSGVRTWSTWRLTGHPGRAELRARGHLLQYNKGSLLGKTGPKGRSLRPDDQIRSPFGVDGVIDITTREWVPTKHKFGGPGELEILIIIAD